MKKPIALLTTTLLLALFTISLATAHDAYYDNHRHFDTDSIDSYRYDVDNYARYYLDDYPSRNKLYYSQYSGDYYFEDYRYDDYYDNYYYSRPRYFTGPIARDFGHGAQSVQIRLDHYYDDYSYRYCDHDYYNYNCDDNDYYDYKLNRNYQYDNYDTYYVASY